MKRFISLWIIINFIASSIMLPQRSYAQEQLNLPAPGTMVNLSPAYVPVLIKGLKVHPENPLLFDFILDTGKSGLKVNSPEFKTESENLIKYFLASLTIKEDDLWVNLSPYEKYRMIPQELGRTELGRDMLTQDYILKQLTASLIYPEKQLGREFWNTVYAKAQQMYGTANVPVNTFNKVWIVADKAKILERNNVAYVIGSHLKVMLEEDYLSLGKHSAINQDGSENKTIHTIASQIVRAIIIPELEREVNQGQNFAPLRQMFYSMILATWYRLALKNALLNQVYSNKGKTGGVLSDDPAIKEKIYEQYLKAYKKGVFNYIKYDIDTVSKQPIPRKYFSGGLARDLGIARILDRAQTATPEELASMDTGDLAMETVNMTRQAQEIKSPDAAMGHFQKVNAGNVSTVISQVAALPADNRVVMIVNTPFEVSNEAAINFLNSGRQNIITLKGPQGVFDEFYFDGHPKSVGASRAILQSVGIDVPEDGILDPFSWPDRTELKQKILSLKDKVGLPLAAVERLEAEKFRTLKTINAQKIKISETPIIFDQGDTAYANLHILDLRVRDKNGQERIVRTYQNSPVITNEVKILGVGPETIKVWGKIIKDAKAVILVGDADEFSEALNDLPDGQIRLQVSANDTKAISELERQDIWKPSENQHLSSQELSLLREADEQDGFHSKRARNDQRITHQIIQIETALGVSRADAESKAEQIIADLNAGRVKFKGEEVHILNGAGSEAKVIGRIDRGIAEKYGYVHETANVVLLTPDGKVLLQLRNKTNYDDHLAMYGGHLAVGESHFSGVLEETKQETGLSILETLPLFVGYESYDMPGDSNRERRSWFVKKLTPDEYATMKASEASEESKLGIVKRNLTRGEYKQALFTAQNERKDGTGEVVGTYEFTFEQLTQALSDSDHNSPFADKTTRFLPVKEQFKDGEVTVNAFFTPDSLNQLLSGTNANLWQSIKKTATTILGDLAMTVGQVETLKGAETEISKILEEQFQRGDITEVVYKNAIQNTYKNLYEWTTDEDIYRIDPSIRQTNLEAISQGRWDDIIEAYRQEVAFGTAGIRGKAVLTFNDLQKFVHEGPLGDFLKGPNTINAFKLLKTTAGVIRFAKEAGRKRIVIGYDSRIGGEQFAQMIARLFIAQSTPDYQFKIFLFDEASPFPELSFGITTDDVKGDIGILLSASHNPADYNGYKITLENGAQLNQKSKDTVVAAIAKVNNSEIILADSLADAKPDQITWLGADEPLAGKDYYGFDRIDMHSLHVGQTKQFILNKQAVAEYGKEVRIGYAAFNGAGFKAVPRLLRETGFTNLQVISKLQRLDGTFPAWKFGEQPDPGDPISADIAVREFIEEHGQKAFDDLDILIGTDPDADRMGLIVKVPEAQQKLFGKYRLLSANDAWTLLLWYRLTMKKQMGLLQNPANHTVVFSHVTTDAIEAVAREFGIEPSGKMLDMTNTEDRGDYLSGRRTWVGFTYLAEALEEMEQAGRFVEMLAEESNGVSIQGHTKEKDGTLAAVLLAEIAAYAKSQNTTIFELLDKVYSQIGHYATANKALPRVGSFEKAAGISEKIKIIQKSEEWGNLANQRAGTANPFMIAGKKVIGVVQFASGRIDKSHYEGVPDEGVRFFFEDETMKPGDNFTNSRNYITIRASGTSQALRFYTQIFSKEATPEQKAFNYHEAERIALEAQKQILEDVGLAKHLSLVTQQLESFNAPVADKAAVVQPPGGIDLNAKNMSMVVSKDGQGIEMKFDPAMVAQFQRGDFSGIVPDIIRITPISSVLPILGLQAA